MFCVMNTGAIRGMEAYSVRVEVDISRGLPGFEVVGSVTGEVKEAKERVQIALKNAGIAVPTAKITINLSPADIRKDGTAYDLPIAAGLLCCMELARAEEFQNTAFLGELALNGELRRVNGVLPIVLAMREKGIKRMVVPVENVAECAEVPGIQVLGMKDINMFIVFLQANEAEKEKMFQTAVVPPVSAGKEKVLDFADVCGQESAKRAAEVAAAGFHHLLLIGPPGTGKSMIAGRIPGILPPLSAKEKTEVASIYSIAGQLEGGLLPTTRPFVSPHHTITPQALAGGGRIPRPGLLSLAHRGILFLDEMPEFSTDVLEVLRQPLEEKKVQIARSLGIYTYPADFMLVCAMNPCPCGYFPDKNKCNCTVPDIRRYLGRISGPVLDRIDIVAEASPVKVTELHKNEKGESTEKIRERVMEARERQHRRYQGSPYQFNGELPGREISKYCVLKIKEQQFLEQIF